MATRRLITRFTRNILCALLIGLMISACSKATPTPTPIPTMGIPTLPAVDPRLITPSPSPAAIFPEGGFPSARIDDPLPSAAPDLLPDGALMRLGMGTLEEVQVSPDGEMLAVRGSIGVYFFDAESLTLNAFCMTPGWPSVMAWSPTPFGVAVGTNNGQIGICRPGQDAEMMTLDSLPDAINMLAWSPDGARFVAMDNAGAAQIWDARGEWHKREMLPTSYGQGAIHTPSGALSPDGTLFAAVYNFDEATPGNAVILWDAETGQVIRWIDTPLEAIAVAWIPNGEVTDLLILDWSLEITALEFWDVDSDSTVPKRQVGLDRLANGVETLEGIEDNIEAQITVSPDGDAIAIQRSHTGRPLVPVIVYLTLTGTFSDVFLVNERDVSDLPGLIWSGDSSQFAVFESGDLNLYGWLRESPGQVIVKDAMRGTLSSDLRTFYGWARTSPMVLGMVDTFGLRDETTWEPIATASSLLSSLAWSPDGTRLAAGLVAQSNTFADLVLWDMTTGTPETYLNYDLNPFSDQLPTQVEWSPDGSYLAVGQYNPTIVNNVNWQPGMWLGEFADGPVADIAWSASTFDLAISSTGGQVRIIPARASASPELFPTLNSGGEVLWTADGKSLIVGNAEGLISLFEGLAAPAARTWSDRAGDGVAVTGLALSPDGVRFAASFAPATGAEAAVWNMQSGAAQFTINAAHGSPTDIAWSPDGTLIVVSFDSGAIGVYDAGRGQELRLLTGHTAAVTDIAFAADGRLASASEDGTILIWQVAGD